MVQHRGQRRQKIADDCARFLALKALSDNLIDLGLINLVNEGLAEIFILFPAVDSWQNRRIRANAMT